jgi:hypothetical protein
VGDGGAVSKLIAEDFRSALPYRTLLSIPHSLFIVFSSLLCYFYLMSVTQTVEIPASHRLTIDVPREVPAGPAVIVFRPAVESSPDITARKAMDSGLGLGLGSGPRIDLMEAIKRCSGIAKRLGINLSSDEFIEMRRQDKEL